MNTVTIQDETSAVYTTILYRFQREWVLGDLPDEDLIIQHISEMLDDVVPSGKWSDSGIYPLSGRARWYSDKGIMLDVSLGDVEQTSGYEVELAVMIEVQSEFENTLADDPIHWLICNTVKNATFQLNEVL